MYLLAPTSTKDLLSTALWFKNPLVRKLHDEKGVDFGFELKGAPESIQEKLDLYWGYHLPGQFATEWYYHPEKRQELLNSISHIADLKPAYVNFHGIHLWWEPPTKEYVNRYANRSESEEYLKVLSSNIELVPELKKIFKDITLTFENYPLTTNYMDNDEVLPMTHLYTGTGRLNDLLYLQEKTGAEIMLDVEHLILTLNFLNRAKNYADLPREVVQNPNLELEKIFGFILEKDVIPYLEKPVSLEKMIPKIAAKHYHVTGSTQDVIPGEKVITHSPIKTDDEVFRKNLRLVLKENPESMLVETANSSDGTYLNYLRPNETELSFYNLCEILLDEL
jgi:hypothetical protein